MTREEYLNQMQEYREELQANAKKVREALDKTEDIYKEQQKKLCEDYKRNLREIRDWKTENQHEVERKMHELKVQWAKEHPVDEVKVVNND
jgi:phage-related protein